MKINVNDSIFIAIQKLSECDVVAATGLLELINRDGQAVAMNRMVLLDELGLRGKKLRIIYEDLCDGSDTKLSNLLLSLSSGSLPESTLLAEVSRRAAGSGPMFGESVVTV